MLFVIFSITCITIIVVFSWLESRGNDGNEEDSPRVREYFESSLALNKLFEIHITIQKKLGNDGIENFVSFCKSIDAKPIVIELSKQSSAITQQPMVSKTLLSTKEWSVNDEIHRITQELKGSDFDYDRIKVEVPLNEGFDEWENTSFYNSGYFEWHGKIECSNEELLNKTLPLIKGVHLSKNSLKNQPNRRFLTVRSYVRDNHCQHDFLSEVKKVKHIINPYLLAKEMDLVKEEFEFCVWDNKEHLDNGWLSPFDEGDTLFGVEMYTLEYNMLKSNPGIVRLMVIDSFVKRAALLNGPFVLKGSVLTRQCINNKKNRAPGDLDYLYIGSEFDPETVEPIFTNWLKEVLAIKIGDKVTFKKSYYSNNWDGVDYAMDDDFPTTYTDVSATYKDNHHCELSIDVSWNLPSNFTPIPIQYQPENGKKIEVPKTVPVPVQIAWKLHQSVVRPRTKDFLDIILLLKGNDLSPEGLQELSNVLLTECKHGKEDPARLLQFVNDDVIKRLNLVAKLGNIPYEEKLEKVGKELEWLIGYELDIECDKESFDESVRYEKSEQLFAEFDKQMNKSGIWQSLNLK